MDAQACNVSYWLSHGTVENMLLPKHIGARVLSDSEILSFAHNSEYLSKILKYSEHLGLGITSARYMDDKSCLGAQMAPSYLRPHGPPPPSENVQNWPDR